MNFWDLFPNVINPILVSRLDSNVEAAIMLTYIEKHYYSDADQDGWIFFQNKHFHEATGLSNNKINECIRYLKNKELLETKSLSGGRLYRIAQQKFSEVSGYNFKPSLIFKLNGNAKAVLLLQIYLDYNKWNGFEFVANIPSNEIKLLSGMDEKSQIYAKNSLLNKNYLTYFDKDNNTFKLNVEELVKDGIITLEYA